MARVYGRTWFKATAAGAALLLLLLAVGCSGVSNRLGKWQAETLLKHAPTKEQCSSDASTPENAECNRAFNLGPLAAEVATLSGFLEPPSPIIQIPASPDVRHVLGGRGEGLNCSIPPLLRELFFNPSQFDAPDRDPVAPLALQFAQACYAHDMCYRHGAATYGYAQQDCDDMLFDQSYRLCTSIYSVRRKMEGDTSVGSKAIDTCMAQAGAVYTGVARFGSGSYRPLGQSTFFEFDPMARARRAPFTVSRVTKSSAGTDAPRLSHYRFGPGDVGVRTNDGAERVMKGASTYRLLQMPAPRPMATVAGDSSQGPHYLVAQRDALRNTGTRLMLLPYGEPSIVQLRRTTDNNVEAFDCNSAMHLPVWSEGKATLYSFGIASVSDSHGSCPPQLRDAATTIDLKWRRLDELAKANFYRLQQLEPLLGRFGDNGEPQLLLLGRGYIYRRDSAPTDADRRRASSGEKYQQLATAFRLSLDNKLAGVDLISVPETGLPVTPFRTDAGAQDALLSLHVPNESKQIHFSLWRRGQEANSSTWITSGPKPMGDLSPSWLEMPAQVVAGPGPDRVVFTRVELDGISRRNCCGSGADELKRAGKAKLQVQMFAMTEVDKMQRVSCASAEVAYPASTVPKEKKMSDGVERSPALSWLSAQAIPVRVNASTLKVYFVPHVREDPKLAPASAVVDVSESSTCEL